MKNKNILLILFIFIAVFSIIIVKPLSNLDEIWNYNMANALTYGLIPYKDVSMVVTPLLPMLTAIILKIFANELIVSRILATILWTGILFTIYKIFLILIKEKNISLILTALTGILCRNIYCIDYNVAVLFIALIILYLELKNIDKLNKNSDFFKYNKKYELLIGILAGLAICTKQSIGSTLAIIVIGYKLLFVTNKEQWKKYLKIAFTRLLGVLIPVLILFIYLLINGAVQDFISYTILGIKTFSNRIKYSKLFQNDEYEIRFLALAVPISIIFMAIELLININKTKNKSEQNKKEYLNLFTLFIYSFSIIIVMYPISDTIHFILGSIIAIIGAIYLIYKVAKNDKIILKIENKISEKAKKKIKKIYLIITSIICIILFAIILMKSCQNLYKYITTPKNKEIKHYNNIIISENLTNKINELDNYILQKENEGKKVYILDAESAIYMIPLDKYNKNYDMFNKGNLGKDGESGIIEEIKSSKNCIYLVVKEEYSLNWQSPLEVIKYVRNNLKTVDSINIYNCYEVE